MPNTTGDRSVVASFVIRRFITHGPLVDLSDSPKGTLHQAADRLGVRRAEFDWMVKLKWIQAVEWAEVQYGISRAGAVDALPAARPESD
ncbi:hypothetical protein [Streptomyces sp. bgisy095]|uniref:hypothetical protein n=1 Tax=unclassified Streptomyces TaxID=2593676 RepID=UPI003D72A9BE